MADLSRDLTELERMVLAGPPKPEDFGIFNNNAGSERQFAEYHDGAAHYWRTRMRLLAEHERAR